MTEETRTAVEAAAATEAEPAEAAYSPGEDLVEGRYIPYSGGSMGWFENRGVLACEEGNNYLFHTAVPADKVRSKQFQRWGEAFNRRGDRVRVSRTVPVTIRWEGHEQSGSTRDVSSHGVRLQFVEELPLSEGTRLTIDLLAAEGGPVELSLPGKVVWSQVQGRIRPVHNLGLMIESLSADDANRLREFMAR